MTDREKGWLFAITSSLLFWCVLALVVWRLL